MSTMLSLKGIDRTSKEAEIYSDNIWVGCGYIRGLDGGDFVNISAVAGEFKVDMKKLSVIFKYYKEDILSLYKNLSFEELEHLPREQWSKIRLGTVKQFDLNKYDIIWLRDFSKQLIKAIDENEDIPGIWKKISSQKHVGNVHDVLNEYEYKCYNAYGILKPLLALCEKALELNVDIEADYR
jgi:hypothetical protein